MAGIFERVLDAWSVVRGLKIATQSPRAGMSSETPGAPPGREDLLTSFEAELFRTYTTLSPDRLAVYADMDEMFLNVIISSALEAYMEDALQEDRHTEKSIWVTSDNLKVQNEIEKCMDRLELEERIEADMWDTCKYGDNFNFIRTDLKHGVFDLTPIPVRAVTRHEDSKRVLQGFTIGDIQTEKRISEAPKFLPWDVIHFKMNRTRGIDIYGCPFFYHLRYVYKILKLMEEQMAIYRMKMHPDRLIFKIFTGQAGPDERMRILRAWKREIEKSTSIDHSLESMKAETKPWTSSGNIYFPVASGEDNSGVEKLGGSANSGDIFDVEYYRDLLFAGLRIPKAYMGFEDSQGYRGTDTLSAQSLKFSRGVKRVQKPGIAGYGRLFKIHLAARGLLPYSPENRFKVHMSPPSPLDEIHRMELFQRRAEAIQSLLIVGEGLSVSGMNQKLWGVYVLKEFGGFTDSEIISLLSPEGSPDLTFIPKASSFMFEMSDDDKERLKDTLLNNPKAQECLREIGFTHEKLSDSVSTSMDSTKIRILENSDEVKKFGENIRNNDDRHSDIPKGGK